MPIRFSIIIATRDISDFLKESIPHLKSLTYTDFEVLIVTDFPQSYDFKDDSRFVLLDSAGNGNPSLKRNIAAVRASGDILAFLDDDAYPRSDWLNMAADIFSDPKVYALGGPAITPIDAGFFEKVSGKILESWMASGSTTYRHSPKKARLIDDYPSVNLMVRKEAFDAVGGFGLEFWPGEDTKLCLDLIKYYGRNFNYDPTPVVYHHRRTQISKHLKQISRYGQHRGQYARIFPENSRTLGYFIPSLFIIGLGIGWTTYFIHSVLFLSYVSVVSIYGLLLLVETFRTFVINKSIRLGFFVGTGIFLTHVVYGVNFIIGFLKRPILKLKAVDSDTGNYVDG